MTKPLTAGERYDEDDPYEDEPLLDEYCPSCGTEYDEIDYEYQICNHCGYNNNG